MSTVKRNLGNKFSPFIHRFEIGIIWVLILGCISRFFAIHNEILGFLNVALAELLIFFKFMKKMKKLDILKLSLGSTSKFFPIH